MRNILFVLAVSTLVSCSGTDESKVETISVADTQKTVVAEESDDVLELVEKRCLICHGSGESHDELLAPPFRGVKNHYLTDYPEKEAFVEAIVKWNASPDSNLAVMKGAIDKFGLMPTLMYPEDEVRAIAEYIYDNEQPKPNWMKK